MEFNTVAKLSSLLCKSFAQDFMRLLVIYKDISASEAASRLDLHIKTAQDFLEVLHELDLVDKEEALEKKRPYYRYTLKKERISIQLNLAELHDTVEKEKILKYKIREKADSGARFATSASGDIISNISIFFGQGRKLFERKVSLTNRQGTFFFYLPFPSAVPESVDEIMQKAGLDETCTEEVLDILDFLIDHNVIEKSE